MLKPLHKKPQRSFIYDADDLERSKEAADLHYSLYERRRKKIKNPDTKHDSPAGYSIENTFYAEIAYNAVQALSSLSDVAYKCSETHEAERIMCFLEIQQKLNGIISNLESFIKAQLSKDSINYRTPSLGKAHIKGVKALQKNTTYLREAQLALKPSKGAAPKI